MLFAAPNSARQLIIAGARSDDEMDEIIAEFKNRAVAPSASFT